PQGDQGAQGDQGPAGPIFFDVFVDDFFTIDGGATGGLPVNAVRVTEPLLSLDRLTGILTPVGYRVAIPPTYGGTNPVTMRLFLRRRPIALPPAGAIAAGIGPFEFVVYAKRLTDGSGTIDSYAAADGRLVTVDAATQPNEFMVIDLPLNVAVPGGLGGTQDLAAGDFLAFELELQQDDDAEYLVLGVEFYETAAAPPVMGATINP
ncbi:MAG: hypothetical protein ACE5F9_15425, partial [Phycisphaerae bacterium]